MAGLSRFLGTAACKIRGQSGFSVVAGCLEPRCPSEGCGHGLSVCFYFPPPENFSRFASPDVSSWWQEVQLGPSASPSAPGAEREGEILATREASPSCHGGEGKRWQVTLDNLFKPLSLSKKAISLIFLLASEGGEKVVFPTYAHRFRPSLPRSDVDFSLCESQPRLVTHKQGVERGGGEERCLGGCRCLLHVGKAAWAPRHRVCTGRSVL